MNLQKLRALESPLKWSMIASQNLRALSGVSTKNRPLTNEKALEMIKFFQECEIGRRTQTSIKTCARHLDAVGTYQNQFSPNATETKPIDYISMVGETREGYVNPELIKFFDDLLLQENDRSYPALPA